MKAYLPQSEALVTLWGSIERAHAYTELIRDLAFDRIGHEATDLDVQLKQVRALCHALLRQFEEIENMAARLEEATSAGVQA